MLIGQVEALFAVGRAVDFYKAAQKSIWPMRENSVKALAQFCGFEWPGRHESWNKLGDTPIWVHP